METYHGHVRNPADAIILFEACRIGLLPRVQRRLSEKERQSIKSGSIFVWDEREAGMRRWTDGKSWSASRVSGSFLTYREMEGKRGGNGLSGSGYANGNTRTTSKSGDNDSNDDGPDGYRYKPDGLMKQSFSITTASGQHLHLISYYSRTASAFHSLTQPSQDPQLRHIRPEKGMYPESTVHDHSSIPAVTRAPMAGAGYAASPPPAGPMGLPYGRPGGAPPYGSYPAPGWAPPSPMHTPPPHYQHFYGANPGGYPPYYGHQPHHHTSNPSYPPPSLHQTHSLDRALPPSVTTLPPPPALQSHPSYPLAPISQATTSASLIPSTKAEHNILPVPQPSPGSAPLGDTGPRHDSVHPRPLDGARKSATPPAVSLPAVSGTTIPSISSLINGAQAASEERARRSASGSPGSTIPATRPLQDIPLHKLGFNPASDARALRDLDKATFRV